MLPIILSAPHGGRQSIPGVRARSGAGVIQFATGRDNNTDELAEKIAIRLEKRLNAKPFLVVARVERKYLDTNRPAESAYGSREAKPYYDGYHDALQEARDRVDREWGRGLLLDIHGQGAQAEAIYRGTGNGKTVVSLTQRFGTEAINRTEKHLQPIGADGVQGFALDHRVLQRRAICGWLYRSNLRQPSWPRY
jgi:N-formylglutamate amidohydrolase